MGRHVERVMLATDLAEGSELPFSVALSLARDHAAILILVHVSELEDYPVESRGNPSAAPPPDEWLRLEDFVQRTEGVACQRRWIRRSAPFAGDAVLQAVREEEANLLVVGAPHHHGAALLSNEKVTTRLMRESPVPVICVYPPLGT